MHTFGPYSRRTFEKEIENMLYKVALCHNAKWRDLCYTTQGGKRRLYY
jgi:hypothetical protein